MSTLSRQQALASARRLFSQQGSVPEHLVAESILRSWRRCADLGQDMRGLLRPQPLTQAELREARERHETLRRLCRPVLQQLRYEARHSGGLVVLTDADGLVLDTEGSADFADRASRVSLMPGAAWSETAAGTNAIGTALVERRPIVVHGSEHYFEPNRILTCAAVPITDPQGRTAGLLDLSGQATDAHGHALGLVRMAVDQIEHRMYDEGYGDCLLVRLHADRDVLGTVREGILAFDGERLVAANRHALHLLSLDGAALGVYRYGDLFLDTPAQAVARGVLHPLRGGGALHARLRWPGGSAQPRSLPAASVGQPEAVAERSSPSRSAPRRGNDAAAAVVHPSHARPGMPWFDTGALAELARAVRLLDAGVSVLLQGETGSGKEVFARRLHAQSARAGGPFVAVNCAALPESLIESELFGYEEGAFTGARRQGSKGLLRQAQGGVLFLDEIGDMPMALQARLLRVLQAREVTPLGAGRAVPVDFALVCATNRPLDPSGAQAVRADLYFRIAEYTVRLPALRDCADRGAVVRALWQSAGDAPALPAEVLGLLAQYGWPGNFRQLASTLRTLRVLADPAGEVRADMLPPEIASLASPVRPVQTATTLQALTDAAIQRALAACEGNISRAARALGVHRSTLYRRCGATGARPDGRN
ncbi:sigma-54-dependent Fis family transcriptional regulator [Bordetella genomosp. 13]|uniref:Sigma-54-dependent Fis family transcriptional regulator n=1 Tax=Bordetella genomosp. 13 TaxID=463040 RepID=A0A1W6Z752_9BORD|nr:sigma-54-dependent Fis family transcriptional regulator [Bordetella genomosp. 13]ARP93218.1 sigma-54-dependent Fis family transcriptional regulator [Bordetella genomosp. 13]